jgi:pyruvate dehydrogenase E2 component (dihydrolipoamide acetyltransferase)
MSEAIFHMPDVGEGLVEAEIVQWKVAVGDVVTLNQPLIDIETAKATVELPSPYAGTVVTLHGQVGDIIAVDAALITFEVDGHESSTTASAPALVEAPVGEGRQAVLIGYGVADEETPVTRQRRRTAIREAPSPATPASAATQAPSAMTPRSTPPVRLYAKQHGVDLGGLRGSGRDGLITRADVERAVNGSTGTLSVKSPSVGPNRPSHFAGRDIDSWSSGALEERIPVRGVLRSMAEAMTESAFSVPRAAAWVRVDATRSVDLLESLRHQERLADVRLSPLTIVAMALCDAARHYPGINSSFDASAGEVVVRRRVNLGIAANTDRGLVVPSIKGADTLDLVGMAIAINTLVDTARAGTATPADMLGTTLTITNVGPFGIDGAVPILPPGTGAIVCVGQVAKSPWVVDDEVVVRHVVELSMAFDHRQIDGALASTVLRHMADYVGDPAARVIAG